VQPAAEFVMTAVRGLLLSHHRPMATFQGQFFTYLYKPMQMHLCSHFLDEMAIPMCQLQSMSRRIVHNISGSSQ
jgi:hypothetical protein